jgi:predicted transcriptional regulator
MKLQDIKKVLEAELVFGDENSEREFRICRGSDLMSDILAFYADGGIFLTGLATLQAVRTAAISGVGIIVFVRGKKPTREVVELANQENIPLLVTSHSMFVACGRLYSSGLAGHDGER